MRNRVYVPVFFFLLTATAWAAPFPSGWARSCKLTVDHTKVSANLTNFPVLVGYYAGTNNDTNLPDEMMLDGGANAAQANGGDIRFTLDAYGTIPLHYEIVTFTQADPVSNARAEIWVKLPALSSTADKDFYVWYDAADAQTTPDADNPHWGSQGVWSNGYAGVWHLNDIADLTDSTRNSNDGVNNGVSAGTGKLGGAGSFSVTDYVQINNPLNQSKKLQEWTVSAWVNINAGDSQLLVADGTMNRGLHLNHATTNRMLLYLNGVPNDYYKYSDSTGLLVGLGWKYVTFAFQNSTAYRKIYVDAQDHTGAGPNQTSTPQGLASTFRLGTGTDGVIDEIRFSFGVRSADWITTEYNNQSAPESFITDAAPEAGRQPATMISVGSITGVSSLQY